MITDLILDVLFFLASFILLPFRGISFVFNMDVLEPLWDVLGVVMYIMPPFSAFYPLIMLLTSLYTFRICISIMKTIWGILPLT